MSKEHDKETSLPILNIEDIELEGESDENRKTDVPEEIATAARDKLAAARKPDSESKTERDCDEQLAIEGAYISPEFREKIAALRERKRIAESLGSEDSKSGTLGKLNLVKILATGDQAEIKQSTKEAIDELTLRYLTDEPMDSASEPTEKDSSKK